MADAAAGSRTAPLRPAAGWRAILDWTALTSLFTKRNAGRSALPPNGRLQGESDQSHDPSVEVVSACQERSDTSFPLLNAYAASAIEIRRQAADLDLNPASLGPVAVKGLVSEVARHVEPLALKAGLALLRDRDSECDGVCCADPGRLRAVLLHLLLRALSMEPVPGHVRVMVMLTGHEAHIVILARTPESTLAAHADAARLDLVASQRLLQAMGGSLVLEPRRAGYLPLCIALPALSAAPALRVA